MEQCSLGLEAGNGVRKLLPNDSCITALFYYRLVTAKGMAEDTILPTEQGLKRLNWPRINRVSEVTDRSPKVALCKKLL